MKEQSLVCSYYRQCNLNLDPILNILSTTEPSFVFFLTRLNRYLPLAVCFVLASCAQSHKPLPPGLSLNSQAHQVSLEQYTAWKIQGKLGFKSSEKKQSASFNWQQNQDQYQLNLTSIIGTSILKMVGDKSQVKLDLDGKTYKDDDASFLIWRMTGWQIPVEHFPLWVKGQHQPQAKVLTAPQGWVTQVQPNCDTCDGWVINYSQYQKVNNIWLPHKILLLNEATNNQLLIRVNSWS